MQAKKGFQCSLVSNYSYSLDTTRESLRRYSEQFESAVVENKPLRFNLSSYDERVLHTFFDEYSVQTPGRLQLLFNDALDDIKMPYAVFRVMRVVGTPHFYCQIKRFDWFKVRKE